MKRYCIFLMILIFYQCEEKMGHTDYGDSDYYYFEIDIKTKSSSVKYIKYKENVLAGIRDDISFRKEILSVRSQLGNTSTLLEEPTNLEKIKYIYYFKAGGGISATEPPSLQEKYQSVKEELNKNKNFSLEPFLF